MEEKNLQPNEQPEVLSIFQQISEALDEEGRLPGNFQLDSYQPVKGTLPFAPGAQDGIMMYHVQHTENPELAADLQRLTRELAEGLDFEEFAARLADCFAERGVRKNSRDNQTIITDYDGMYGCIDELQKYIVANGEQLPPQLLFESAIQLLLGTRSVGVIKYALVIMELLAQVTGKWRDLVRQLAAYDEFTLYCVYIARYWENAEQELWQMARRTQGWGRIHAIDMLPPQLNNPELQAWLLDEGWRNDVLVNYTAADCACKGDLAGRLRQPSLTAEQFAAAGGLLAALLEEQPLYGISDKRLTEPEQLLADYLRHAAGRSLGEEERSLLADMAEYAARQGWQQVQAEAEALL